MSKSPFDREPADRAWRIIGLSDAIEIAATSHAFERLYSNWLHARAIYHDPSQDRGDAACNERADRIDLTGRELLSASAPARWKWMVWWKWEVLEEWLKGNERWSDNRVAFAVGCIKADLQRVDDLCKG
jgi:hypothetical protein